MAESPICADPTANAVERSENKESVDPVTPAQKGRVDTSILAPPTAPAVTAPIDPENPTAPPPAQPMTASLRQRVTSALGHAMDDVDPSSVATFKSLRGKTHQITLEASEMLRVKQADGTHKSIPDPLSGKTVSFEDWYRATSDVREILLLCKNPAFDLEYTIDEEDPTGYWRKLGVVEFEAATVMVRKSYLRRKDAQEVVAGKLGHAQAAR